MKLSINMQFLFPIIVIIGTGVGIIFGINCPVDVLKKDLPNGIDVLASQAGGHPIHVIDNIVLGLLKDRRDGSILKAASSPQCGVREINFYESLMHNSNDPNIKALRNLVPEYRGTMKVSICGQDAVFIKLADLTHNMKEPCVIDIKMGRQTWDPLATPDRIKSEDDRYNVTKQLFGFGVPGIRLFDLKTGRVKKFGKEYGKQLTQHSVKDAFKMFLNADTHWSKPLVARFLTLLKPIGAWAQSQTSLRLYATSLILAYDAKQLEKYVNCINYSHNQRVSNVIGSRSECESMEPVDWAFIKMIDFASVFPAENASVDTNYLFAIQNLVNLFEEILRE